jgi:hypothetical protein
VVGVRRRATGDTVYRGNRGATAKTTLWTRFFAALVTGCEEDRLGVITIASCGYETEITTLRVGMKKTRGESRHVSYQHITANADNKGVSSAEVAACQLLKSAAERT